MPEIVLATLNAKYVHAAFGLRYLMANLGDLQPRAAIREFDINQRVIDIVEAVLAENATIVGFGVYIWNVELTTKVIADLKRLRPKMTIVVGGPEVSFETDQQEICGLADYVVRGEADLAFAKLCETLLAGRRPLMGVIDAELPEFTQLALPYALYDEQDLKHRVMYVEASRGCPFKCEFCLSSLDVPVRNAPLDGFLEDMQRLLDRGAKQFKFVDRTFNLNLTISRRILEFFLERYTPGLFVHFEMIPDRLPEALRAIIAKFPAGALQFEVGIQSLNPEVESRISRRQDHDRLADNLTWLRDNTGVHVHADLIVGLPGEDLVSFGRGFDRLYAWRPQEIQVGILKRLRGAPIVRHDADWGMVYSPHAPYEILQTAHASFEDITAMRRFSRYWDLVANSGNFNRVTQLLLDCPSPFERFFAFSAWLYERTGHRTHGIGRGDLTEALRSYLIDNAQVSVERTDAAFKEDQRPRRKDLPKRQAQHAEISTLV
ncbi:MAG: Radical domain protein [Phycisphaerales bacterium]|nr:Radical domain protein [Phycisphaerales bacterium]